ncbi:MAG: restriction endonuclease fold toxin 5 domain-containing protein [Gammaproteobacteria bacterium]
MAALAGPLLGAAARAAAQRVVAGVVAGAAAGVTAEAVKDARKRQDEAEKARSAPIARAEVQTKAKAEKCKECPPDRGVVIMRKTAGWSELSIAYQARIGGMPVVTGAITEWLYNGIAFDGFDSSQCLLKEAKARYDQFFDRWGAPHVWWEEGADNLINEAMQQGAAAVPRPPTRLRWHFMEPLSYRYFSLIIQAAHPDVEVAYLP